MKITRARIKNFRCLRDIEIEFGSTTVLIGENSVGKTAVLEAIRTALTRRWGQRGTGFAEYDFYAGPDSVDPKSSEGISVVLYFQETQTGEWHDDLLAALVDVIQPDTKTGLNSIILRATCQFDAVTNSFVTTFEFLNRAGDPLRGKAARSTNTNPFFDYVPAFALSALRDVGQEFSARSAFWGQLLKRISISDSDWKPIEEKLTELNSQVLGADKRLDAIRTKIQGVRDVVALGAAGDVSIRALPMKVWDLIQRAEIVIQGARTAPWLPLDRQGQGVQSLSIIYLFQAFVDQLLHEVYPAHSEPVLLLEEPEAHLHPQAARGLGREIGKISGQKIISTHSPHFIEKIDLDDIRIIRHGKKGSVVFQLRRTFRAVLPKNPSVTTVAAKYPNDCVFDNSTGELRALRPLPKKTYQELLACFPKDPDKGIAHPALKTLLEESNTLIDDEDLIRLEEWARRVRGEIFFAKLWLLCEGQSEYLLLHAAMRAMKYPLDRNGVAVIDYQNNGNPAAFASLARALGFPWLMMCDGDPEGDKHIQQLKGAHFDATAITQSVRQLPRPYDLEGILVASPLRKLLSTIGPELGVTISATATDVELEGTLRSKKPLFAHIIAGKLIETPQLVADFPQYFRDLKAEIES